MLLGEPAGPELRPRQPVKTQGDARVLLDLEGPHNEALAGATGQQRDAPVYAQDVQDLLRAREEARGHEHQPKRHRGRAQLPAKILRPSLQTRLLELPGPMIRDRIVVNHVDSLTAPE